MFRIGFLQQNTEIVDNIPESIDFENVFHRVLREDGTLVGYEYTEQFITGITGSITLEITYPGTDNDLYFLVDPAPGLPNSNEDPVTAGYAYIASGEQIVVNNEEYIKFGMQSTHVFDLGTPYDKTTTITVKNISDSGTILDTFDTVYEEI